MSKYMHDFNADKCRLCSRDGLYEEDERTEELVKKADLLICLSCRNVKYCCKEHQVEDWPNHKKFCKRFRKVITEYKNRRDSRPRGSPKPARPTPYPLHDFIRRGDWRGLLRYVTDDHPTYDVNEIDSRSPEFMSPLVLACGQGQIECVHILLDHGANYTDECVSGNMTPLIYASWWGHDDIVQLLINHGADVNYANTHQLCALTMACQHLQPEVVKVLLRHGANVDQRNFFGWTSLILTVCMSGTDQPGGDDERTDLQRNAEDNPKVTRIVKMLLGAGADINARGAAFGATHYKEDTALNMCSNKIEILELLISEGALLDVQRESDGRNALLAAAEHKRTADLELLIRSGADITLRDNNGRNYLDWLEIPWNPDE